MKNYNVGGALELIREQAGLTLRELSELLKPKNPVGYTYQQLATYEANKNEPKLDKIHKIVSACGDEDERFFKLAVELSPKEVNNRRVAFGGSIEYLSEETGISKGKIQRFFRAQEVLRLRDIKKIYLALGVRV